MLVMLLNLLVLLFRIAAAIGYPAINEESLGLIAFKAVIIDPQNKLSSWNGEVNDNPCSTSWVGVTCKRNKVTQLNLDGFSLSGHIGKTLLSLQSLRNLTLSNNNFTGIINPSLAQLGSLEAIDLSNNKLSGPIPDEFFEHCGPLREVSFAKNNLSGSIPRSMSSCFGLLRVDFSSNQLTGSLPAGVWSLTQLRSLDLSDNLLDGEIPAGIGRLYALRFVDLSKNKFSGQLPEDIGSCSLLKSADFSENSLSGYLPQSMQRLGIGCTSLKLGMNSFSGVVPDWIGEMRSLVTLDLSGNNFSGPVPNSLGNLRFMKDLNLSLNQLTGNLPTSLSNCGSLLALDISRNRLTGNVTLATSYQGLQVLDLSSNALSGEIPPLIGIFSSLVFMNLSRNLLIGSIPASIRDLSSAVVLDVSRNRLSGSIPLEIGRATSLKEVRLNHNFLTGRIPVQLENCATLSSLFLSHNNLTGPIPAAMGNLTNLQNVDLSSNSLSGSLPKELTYLSRLRVFNISYNYLQGALPLGGFFNTIPPSSVFGNSLLCGSAVDRSCPAVHPKPIVLNPNTSSDSNPSNSMSPHHKRIILSISALVAIGAAVFIAIGVATVTVLNIHARSAMMRSAAAVPLSGGDDYSCSPTTDANYGKLYMFSGDADFVAGAHALLNKDCELGRGGFGAVYRATLRDGRSVAIKKLTVSSLIKSQEEFEREVKKLGKIRHINLVTLEGYYWTSSLQLLIYEYISNGSLHKHLHEEADGNCLSWKQRFNVVLGMAKGLAHLHQLNIIHYNLKSTNILIDSSGEPKVGDFGLARLLPMLDHYVLSSKVQSALGYMAPEFACRTVKITEKCDVYGFGILVLEVVTGKKPVEYMEDDVVVLCDMVRGSLEGGRVEECVDARLHENFPADEAIPLIKLGLICASQVPSNRPDMGEVVNILELIQCPSEGQEELE